MESELLYLGIVLAWTTQGHNQVCSQRWARLENFPFPGFFPHRSFHFGTPQTNSIGFRKWQARKKKGPLLIFIPFPFHCKFFSSPFTISFFFLSIFPFFLASLFPFLLFFLFLPFFLLSLYLPKFPPNFLPTPSYATVNNAYFHCCAFSMWWHKHAHHKFTTKFNWNCLSSPEMNKSWVTLSPLHVWW